MEVKESFLKRERRIIILSLSFWFGMWLMGASIGMIVSATIPLAIVGLAMVMMFNAGN